MKESSIIINRLRKNHKKLKNFLKSNNIQEVILATNPTVEGEATAFYIAEQCQHLGIHCSRLASGIPMGGELEFLDGRTIERALDSRQKLQIYTQDVL